MNNKIKALSSANSGIINHREINFPKAGNTVAGPNESFKNNTFSGIGSYSIPFPVTPARGLEPGININYSSNAGNSVFGYGFSLTISKISISTKFGIPKYDGSETYLIDGEELLLKNIPPKTEVYEGEEYNVAVYIPRVQSDAQLIEKWDNTLTGLSFWRIISNANLTRYYGCDDGSRISNPADKRQIFEWLIYLTYDANGNKIAYDYKKEDKSNIPVNINEQHRVVSANRYLKNIRYGNYMKHGLEHFAFDVVFNYGEILKDNYQLYPNTDNFWSCRPDPYSVYKSGFEIRTYRRCTSILLFHCFMEEFDVPCLNKSLNFYYEEDHQNTQFPYTSNSKLTKVIFKGFRRNSDEKYTSQEFPPINFSYNSFTPILFPEFKTLNIPNPGNAILNDLQLLPVDLDQEGLPGLLYISQEQAMYCTPQGNGNYSAPANCFKFPNTGTENVHDILLSDIDGDGQLELVYHSASQSGFFQRNTGKSWDNFIPFLSMPMDIHEPIVEYTDLNGSGKTDAFITKVNELIVYPSAGEKGFSRSSTIPNTTDFPPPKQDFPGEYLEFANIFGDGLLHRVRITNGLVECWPNLGFGKTGDKIILENAPVFKGDFDKRRLFLADIDGSGTADLIYVYSERIEIFFNLNGNGFSKGYAVRLPDIFTDLDKISFADILGNGINCLLFTKTGPVPVHYYYEFSGSAQFKNDTLHEHIKPMLLSSINNNLGLISEFYYASSVQFYLEDKSNGQPWITNIPFPVSVVTKIKSHNELQDTTFTNIYKYHEGHYDSSEREFCGFAYTESWDAEMISNDGTPNVLRTPPSYLRIWQHTGAFLPNGTLLDHYRKQFNQADKECYLFPETAFKDLSAENEDTIRQANFALKGSVFRQEVYGVDNLQNSDIPYTVEEQNQVVVLLQKAVTSRYAAFFVADRENILYNYERNFLDPRITQEFVIETDPLSGEVVKAITVHLPRRNNNGIEVQPEQTTIKAVLAWSDYINTDENRPYRYRGLLCGYQTFEISGLKIDIGNYFGFQSIVERSAEALTNIIPYGIPPTSASILTACQLSRFRNYFWNDSQEVALDYGEISHRALLHHQANAKFTNEYLSISFEDRLPAEIVYNHGGYIFDEGTGYWENKGLTQYYFKEPYKFYLACGTENSFADQSSSLYKKTRYNYDNYYLNLIKTSDYLSEDLQHEVTCIIDYQAGKPRELKDSNNNISQVIYDAVGQMLVFSHFGMENSILTGGMRLYEENDRPAEYIIKNTTSAGLPISFQDVLANPEYYLQGASSYFFYDLGSYNDKGNSETLQPTLTVSLLNNHFYHPDSTDLSCQKLITYVDGSGRILQKKQFFASVENPGKDWLASGETVYNNKGFPALEYLPYRSSTPHFSNALRNERCSYHTTTLYDPILRKVKVITPKGFFSKIAYTAWDISRFDENDTVLDSSYYLNFLENYPSNPTITQQDEMDALNKAVKFYDTPTIDVLDNAGYPFLSIAVHEDQRQVKTYLKTDIQGRTIVATDPRLYAANKCDASAFYSFKHRYFMDEKEAFYTDSSDAGLRMQLKNIFGKSIWNWSPRAYCQLTTYDKLQRKNTVSVQKVPVNNIILLTNFNNVERYIYGEHVPNAKELNLWGNLFQLYDLSGLVTNSSYSINGDLLKSSRNLINNYKIPADWNTLVKIQDETFTVSRTYGPLKNLLAETTPDNSVAVYTYNVAGLLDQLKITYPDGKIEPIIDSIRYNEQLQRTSVQFANAVITRYTYELTTGRIISIQSRREKRQRANKKLTSLLQNILHTYDGVGNLTRVRDFSFETVFNSNQQVSPLTDYSYDALYRLVAASGRQHPGISANTYRNNISDNDFKQSKFSQLSAVSISDPTKLINYVERFDYDDSGNMVIKNHRALNSNFVTRTPVNHNSNQLANGVYDAAGNLRKIDINNAVSLYYNCCDNLVKAAVIERPDEKDDSDYYMYDSKEQRTVKVSERYLHGGAITEAVEHIYFGNYEVKRIVTTDSYGNRRVSLDRQSLRVMDNNNCVAIIHNWEIDENDRERPGEGVRSLRFQLGNFSRSVSMELDRKAFIISYEEYFPYGGTSIIAGKSSKEVSFKTYRYSGKERDDSSGFYYYGARYYIPWFGRWAKPDPGGTVDGLNLFAFAVGNPVTNTDQNGMSIKKGAAVKKQAPAQPVQPAAKKTPPTKRKREAESEEIREEIEQVHGDQMVHKKKVHRSNLKTGVHDVTVKPAKMDCKRLLVRHISTALLAQNKAMVEVQAAVSMSNKTIYIASNSKQSILADFINKAGAKLSGLSFEKSSGNTPREKRHISRLATDVEKFKGFNLVHVSGLNNQHAETKILEGGYHFDYIGGTRRPCFACSLCFQIAGKGSSTYNAHSGAYWDAKAALLSLFGSIAAIVNTTFSGNSYRNEGVSAAEQHNYDTDSDNDDDYPDEESDDDEMEE